MGGRLTLTIADEARRSPLYNRSAEGQVSRPLQHVRGGSSQMLMTF